MTRLFTYSHDISRLDSLVQQLNNEDELVLLGQAIQLEQHRLLGDKKVYVLADQLQKRNFEQSKIKHARIITVAEFVSLTEKHPKFIAW